MSVPSARAILAQAGGDGLILVFPPLPSQLLMRKGLGRLVEGDPGASHWVRVALLYMPGYIMTTPSWVSSDSLAVLGCQPTPVCRESWGEVFIGPCGGGL